ncbi:uncharacterized protein isoform X1 [Salmo salar]|uniref:Uncharacterized protein isoform X1 n=1 Tax=Salmo salar TaxID=8030 RepID=A0A1S3RLC5_SALSA|nr:uncharacterized protein LOC106603442 isoform X1 [Salmo salar]|eukprot:XP_014052599.1 PREDICTED: uncharacterized protein LOC106603442 isoform X1 [Salmo salar]
MSNMKRQSSWQEDIARNFSRLFQISKSQDPEKTEESDISGQQNGVNSSLRSETCEGEPSLHQEDLELSKTFQGTEEEGDVREGVLGEALEDRESQGKEKGGEGSSSISDDAGGSSKDQPLVPPPLVDSVPCSPASPPGPDSPKRPPPLDAFFRRLGSLFHFKAEPATAVQQHEEQQQAEEGGEGQEEGETALAVGSIEPDLSGMTCGAEGDQDHCDSAGSLTGEQDTRHTETEDRGEGESDLHSVSTSTRSPTHTDLETLEKPNTALEETQAEGHRGGCREGKAAADSSPLSEVEEAVDEHQRRLALACPPVVTYGTYCGQRDKRRMRRRHQVQVESPNSGVEGSTLGAVTHSTLELAISKQSDIQTVSINQIGATTSETNERGAWTSETDSVLGPTGPESSHIPLTTQTAERAVSQSAFPSSGETSLATVGGQAKDSLSRVGSITCSPPAPTEDSADARTSTAVSETHSAELSPRDKMTHAEMASEDMNRDTDGDRDTGLSECFQTGSPSFAAAWPGTGGTAQDTHLPAAVSDGDGGQLAPHSISPSASLLSATESQGPIPATRHSDSGDALDTGPGAGLHCFESGKEEGDVGPPDDLFEEALHLESKMMVDNIVKNALAALERIESSELEEGEVLQKASEEIYLVLPVGRVEEEDVDPSFEPDKLVEVEPSERGDDRHPSAVPAEQTLSLNPNPLSEGPRSTPSSGYESIAGSDTDIRSSPGPACESSAPTFAVSDHRQGEHCAEGTKGTGLQLLVKGQRLMDANEQPQGEEDSQPNDPIESEYSGDKHQKDVFPLLGGRVSFEKPGLYGDDGDIIQIMRAGLEYESVSGKTNENKDQVLCTSGDNGCNEVLGVKETQVGDGAVHVAKDDIESNRHSPKQDGNAQYGHVSVSNNSESPNKLKSTLNDNTYLRNQTAFPEPDLLRKSFKYEAKGNSEANLMSVRPKHTPNSIEPSQVRHAISQKPVACITLYDDGQESGPEISLKVGLNGLNDIPVSGDQSFVLVETYLASVFSEGSDSGGEEDEAHCRTTGTISMDPSFSRRLPKDLSTSEGLVSNSATDSSNEDRPQLSSVSAYRCNISLQQQSQDSETLGHSGAGSATAVMAGFHQDLGSRLAGLHATGGRRAPGLEPLLPLLPVPQLAFHDMEASGFSIIDEEEETDAVFVNDTGPMLSPTVRRAKAYPFSLSPIVEEDSLRSEAEGGLSREDRGLMVPPATEELRSLSGGVGMEQLASSSSLSILSLLQSVSERLQSSGYSDNDADSEEPSTPPLRRPLWEFFNRGQGEDKEGDGQGMDGDQSSKQEGPGSLTLPTDLFTMGPRDGDPMKDVKNLSTPWITIQKPADSPMYQYLKSVHPVLLEPDDDNSKHHAKLIPRLSDNCPSTATDIGGNWSYGKVIPRPTLMNIYDGVTFSGEMREIHRDQEDSGMVFPQGASVRVLGGCWLLYLEPGFRGPGMLLEEGETVLSHQPGQQQASQGTEDKPTTITIGSIRRLVKDDGTPEIHLLPAGVPGGATERLNSEADSLGTRVGPIHLSNLTVKSGCWLAYCSPGFHGNYAVMEAGGSTTPGVGHPQVTTVRSLRPLRMSGLRVRRPLDPKMLVFEQPLFQGQGRELRGQTPSLGAVAGLKGASSLRVIGGVWVGYTGEDYTGRQYLLEEGEYSDCADLGGADHPLLLSFRFLQADFIEPSVSLQEDTGSPGAGRRDILDLDVPDLEKDGATEKTTTFCVKSGVWVAYSEKCFSGEQCILEKGKHPATLHWGGNYGAAKSIRPIRLQDLYGTREPKFMLWAYSQPHYRGVSEGYEGEAGHCGSASPMSFRVIRGSWLLFDEEGCCGNQYVLGEGLYPDLISCGCVAASVKSLRPIPYSFSDPSISLFSLSSFEGLKMVVVTPTEHMKDFFTQSLQVHSGLWVVYEYSNYKGCQMLLQPGELPMWGEHSGWDTIGSLRPLKQPRLYVQVKSRALGSLLTSESVKDDSSPARVILSPACSLDTQRWLFTGGLLRCKASKACLSVIGGKATVGARVALWPEHGRTHQRWSLNHNGTISSHLNHKLVLDLRGGTGFKRDHLVVNEFATDQATQFWDIEEYFKDS